MPVDRASLSGRARVATTVRERVAIVVELMGSGDWDQELSRWLAGEWAVTHGAVRRYASEANHLVCPATVAEAQARSAAMFDWAEELIPKAPNPAAEARQLGVAWGRIHGLGRPAPRPASGGSGGSSGSRNVDTDDEDFGTTDEDLPHASRL